MRIGVVTAIPTPYRDPLWNAVAKQPDVELDVYYCANQKGDRPWDVSWRREFRHEVLHGVDLAAWAGNGSSCFFNFGILKRLRRGQHDALLIGGYNHPTLLAAISYAQVHRVPYFLMNESHLLKQRSGLRRMVKRRFVCWVVSNARGGFPTGRLASQYLIEYGAAAERLCVIPNIPDVAALSQQAGELNAQRAQLRRERGLDENLPVVLFAGRLIPKKNAATLIRAFHAAGAADSATLVIVGDGPLRGELEKLASELGISHAVRFAGFVEPREMSDWYAIADLFVLPSSETWGVVVLEAAACGLPVIVSDRVGCHPDVVTDSAIGDVVMHNDVDALADALRRRLATPIDRNENIAKLRPMLAKYHYDVLATKMVDALREMLVTDA